MRVLIGYRPVGGVGSTFARWGGGASLAGLSGKPGHFGKTGGIRRPVPDAIELAKRLVAGAPHGDRSSSIPMAPVGKRCAGSTTSLRPGKTKRRATVDRRWFIFPAFVAGFLLQHAVQGWCPPLPVLRRLGFRTQPEIDYERYALKSLRGDFCNLPSSDGQSGAVARQTLATMRG